jgi:hypothetical protein
MNTEIKSSRIFVPRYSATSGEMWVCLGEFSTLSEAIKTLRGYAKAGNATHIIEIFPEGIGKLRTFEQLIADGLAQYMC